MTILPSPDPETLAAYDTGAAHYAGHRRPRATERARTFNEVTSNGTRLDLGCGPGLWFDHLSRPLVGLDASRSMLDEARARDDSVPLVRAALEGLPFARGAFQGVWANKCLQHVAAADLPLVLADLHRIIAVEGTLSVELFAGTGTIRSDDDLPGRRFTLWDPAELEDVLAGAGFGADPGIVTVARSDGDLARITLDATRLRTLPDTVGPDMGLLICGLNPSLVAADAGVGFAGPTNRFWKALHASGLSRVERDPFALLLRDGIGMTDLVKRATRAAKDLRHDEYRRGVARLTRVVARMHPAAVCLVGLTGWRVAVDAHATPGWQPDSPLGAPTYVMPSTSGLNAHATLADLTAHLRRAAAPPDN